MYFIPLKEPVITPFAMAISLYGCPIEFNALSSIYLSKQVMYRS